MDQILELLRTSIMCYAHVSFWKDSRVCIALNHLGVKEINFSLHRIFRNSLIHLPQSCIQCLLMWAPRHGRG